MAILNKQISNPEKNIKGKQGAAGEVNQRDLLEQCHREEQNDLVGIFGAGNKLLQRSAAEQAAKEAMERIRKAAAGECLSPRELPRSSRKIQ